DQIVQHCDYALLLEGGRLRHEGKPRDVVNRYYDLLFGKGDRTESRGKDGDAGTALDALPPFAGGDGSFETRPNYNPYEYRWGDGAARIVDFELRSADEVYPTVLDSGTGLRLTLRIVFDREVVRPILGFFVKTKEGVSVYASNTEYKPMPSLASAGAAGSTVDVALSFDCNLADGDYFFSVGVASRNEVEVVPHD